MSFSAIFLMFGIIFIGIMIILVTTQSATENKLSTKLSSIHQFTPSASYVSTISKHGIAIDIERRKIAIARTGLPTVIDFADIVAVELVRDNNSVHKTNRGSQFTGAAVGAVLLGPVGLIVGGLSGSKRQENKIKRLSLRLYTKNILSPIQEMVFIEAPGGIDTHLLNDMIKTAELWYGRVRGIVES